MFWRDSISTVEKFLRAVSAERFDSALRMCADDVHYIDSMGEYIEGIDACRLYFDAMAKADLQLRIHVEKISRFGQEVLVSGHCTSRDPRFNAQCQWRIETRRRKITRYQSFRGSDAVSFIHAMQTRDPELSASLTSG